MRAGALRIWVEVYELVEGAPSASGARTRTETLIDGQYARVIWLKGREAVQAGTVQADADWQIEMRRKPSVEIKPKHRVKFTEFGRSHVAEIIAAGPWGRRGESVRILATEEKIQ